MTSPKRPAGPVPAVGDKFEVQIEKLAVGGAGVARADGFVLFVNDAAPGDRLRVRVSSVKGNFGEARIEEILQAGPGRRAPPCVYATECGGCNWQHLDEKIQHEQKQLMVKETLERFLPGREIPLLPFQPSPVSLRYRNRVQPRWKDGQVGFFKRRRHEFLPVKDCLITEEPLAEFFRNPPPVKRSADDPEFPRLEFRLTEDGKVQWSKQGEQEEGFGFSQVNRFQNQDLIRTVLDWCKDLKPTAIWDLYSGAGNFSFPLADAFPQTELVAVELNAKLIQHAKELTKKNSRARFMVSDVGSWLKRRTPPAGSLVVIDPPRAGAGPDIARELAESSATCLIYIACHPVSLARDLAAFLSGPHGTKWKLTRVQAFEMFPQTDHVETIAQLEVDSL